jgi:hypothetical protein
MRTNLFVGVEGTHSLLSDTFDGDQFALPTLSMLRGPEARQGWEAGLEHIISNSFSVTAGKTECNIGITRTGAKKIFLINLLTICPSGTRVWFFKSTDNDLTKTLFETDIQNSTAGAVERITGKLRKDITVEDYATLSAAALDDIDTAASNFTAGDWTYFNLSYYNGGAVPTTGTIMTRLMIVP